jgi:simple sugar transport system permease protein
MSSRARWAAALTATAAVLLVFDLAVWLAGASPLRVLGGVVEGTVGSGYAIGQTLAKATPILWTGAAVALALRARLFNIGAEGQCLLGVLGAAIVGAWLPASTPWPLAVPVTLAAAAFAGALPGAFAGWLKARFGTHEVISTLMLNGLVAVFTTWLYAGPLRVGAQVHTRPVVTGARLPLAGEHLASLRGSGLSASIVLAIAAALAVGWYLQNTRGGVALRAVGSSPGAAEALGVDTGATTVRAMALSGALAGLAGTHYVLGVKGYAEQGLGAGVGFTGIAVALLGGMRPGGVIVAAVLFGALAQGALAVNAIVPADVLTVVQAATILAVAAVGVGSLGAREGR